MTATPPLEPGARRALRVLLRGGPAARAIARADLALFRLVRRTARPPWTGAVGRFSRVGEHAVVWLAIGAAGAALDAPRRPRWRRGGVAVAGTYALNTVVKAVFRRRRPALEELPALVATPTALSSPSAHASSSFAAARAYAGLLPAAPLYAAGTAMAVSRVHLGVHYPTDVAAGAVRRALVGGAAR